MNTQQPTAFSMPLLEAQFLGQAIKTAWNIQHTAIELGALRRGVPAVSSIDLSAPMPTGQADPLFETINAGMASAPGLFGAAASGPITGRAISGLAPGFQRVTLTIDPMPGFSKHPMPVTIYRFRESNRGLVELLGTGPRSFLDLFWHRWRKLNAIPEGSAHRCMREGDLVDGDGNVVPTPEERDVFKLVRWDWIDPRRRATVGQAAAQARKRADG